MIPVFILPTPPDLRMTPGVRPPLSLAIFLHATVGNKRSVFLHMNSYRKGRLRGSGSRVRGICRSGRRLLLRSIGFHRLRINRLDLQIVDVPGTRLDLKQRRHEFENCRTFRHETLHALFRPCGNVLAEIRNLRSGRNLRARRRHIFHHDARIEPWLGTRLKIGNALLPGNLKSLCPGGNLDFAVHHHQRTGSRARHAQEMIPVLNLPTSTRFQLRPTVRPLIPVGVRFEIGILHKRGSAAFCAKLLRRGKPTSQEREKQCRFSQKYDGLHVADPQ